MELKLTSEIDLLSVCVATNQKLVCNLQTNIVDQCDLINMYEHAAKLTIINFLVFNNLCSEAFCFLQLHDLIK